MLTSMLFSLNNISLAVSGTNLEKATKEMPPQQQLQAPPQEKIDQPSPLLEKNEKKSFFNIKRWKKNSDKDAQKKDQLPEFPEVQTIDLKEEDKIPESMLSKPPLKIETTVTDVAQPQKAPGMDIDMVSDYLDYYPEEEKIVAKGNAQVKVRGQDTVLKADLITFYRDTQIIVAEKNVKIVKNQMEMVGDYVKMDLSEESALVSHPVTDIALIKIDAKEAIVHSDNIDAFKGTATTKEKMNLVLIANSFNQFGDAKQELIKDAMEAGESGRKIDYRIKTKQIIIKPDDYSNRITMKNADVYIGKIKVATIPSMTMSTDKELSEIQTMMPEFGQTRQTGMYIGPAGLVNLPKGSSLKLAPVLAFDTSSLGAGGMIRFKNETNRTLFGYTSVKDLFILQGEQDLFNPNLKLRYTANSYSNDWFMGDRLPKYSAEITYQKPYLLEDLDLIYEQRYAAGYVADAIRGIEENNSWGTLRIKAQGEIRKNRPIYNWRDIITFNYRSQYDLSVYGTGETYAILRTGPDMGFKYKRFKMRLMYMLSGIGGETPLWFDQYYYGRNNLSGVLEYKVNKYLSVGYFGSANLSKDNYDERLMAENRLYAKFGPPDFKICLGYDTVRSRMLMDVNMLVGSDNSKIDFDKLTIIDPQKLEKKKKKAPFWEKWRKETPQNTDL